MQKAHSLFHSNSLRLYNINFPKQKLNLKYNTRKLWLTQGLKDDIKKKNKLDKNYIKCRHAIMRSFINPTEMNSIPFLKI